MYGQLKMAEGTPPPAPRSLSAWGDREQRRRDVLDAAARTLEESGWAGLSMREVARGAGVSPGAIYQWFDGKDEIFTELFRARLWAGVHRLADVPDDVSLHDFVRSTLDWVIALWAELGRYLLDFTDMALDAGQREMDDELGKAFMELTAIAAMSFRAAAERDGVEIIAHPQRSRWVWGAMIGTAERVIALHLESGSEEREAYLDFAARSLVASLSAT
jgi:AcrR family transcriptional regulator